MTPAGTSIDVQNEWEENTHTHTQRTHSSAYKTYTAIHTHARALSEVFVATATIFIIHRGMGVSNKTIIASNDSTTALDCAVISILFFSYLLRSRLTNFYRDASSALFQTINQWLNLTNSRSHAFRYGRKNTNPTLVRIELTTSALAGEQVTY